MRRTHLSALRRTHLGAWLMTQRRCKRRSRSALTSIVSVKICSQSANGLLLVSIVWAGGQGQWAHLRGSIVHSLSLPTPLCSPLRLA